MKPSEQLHRAALLAVACNTIMLEVCDILSGTQLYKQDRKQRINALTKDLEGFMSTFYKDRSEEEELEFHRLVRTIETACKTLAQLSPASIGQFTALLMAFQKGEIFEANSDKGMEGLIKTKRVKPIGVIHSGTGQLL